MPKSLSENVAPAAHEVLSPETCPVARSLDVVGDRWSLLIVRDAFDGQRRFGDFQRNLGVARNILSDRLRRLVDAGVLETHPASDGTSYQEYVLTAEGKDLFPVVVALRQWGERHRYARGEPHSVLVDRYSGKPLAPMIPRSHDGRTLESDETQVKKSKRITTASGAPSRPRKG